MSEELNVFVLDKLGNNYLGQTKEQIIATIQEELTSGNVPSFIDKKFLTKLREINSNQDFKIWIGSTAEFQSLTSKDATTFYILSDDNTVDAWESRLTNLETAVSSFDAELQTTFNQIKAKLDELGF